MNYIITGGEFNNKGAEAMTLLTISRIRQHDSNAKIILISNNPVPKEFENIKITRYAVCNNTINYLLTGSKVELCKAWIKNAIKFIQRKSEKIVSPMKLKKIYKNCAFTFDISGFALSSKFNETRSQVFLDYLRISQKYQVKSILMPQSFGPFDFKTIAFEEMKNVLQSCHLIYAREKEGYDYLKNMGLNRVILSTDMVLTEKEIDYRFVFPGNPPKSFSYVLDGTKNYVGIIPNFRTLDSKKISLEHLLGLYRSMTDLVLSAGKSVYLIPHAKEDIMICSKIKAMYSDNTNVILIDKVLHSYEYQELVSHFDYIIASRYHSIIHAYKEATPALILGWAVKYKELAERFEQTEYVFDITDDFSSEKILTALQILNSNHEKDSEFIRSILNEIQKNDLFLPIFRTN